MDSLVDSLVAIQGHLRAASIESIAIGGMAVSVWGVPRLTRDVDVKVLLEREDSDRLLAALPADYRPLGSDPSETLRQHAMLFVQDPGGNRIDLLLTDIGFDESAIRRGVQIEVRPGVSARMCTPEDLIIYKLIATRPQDQLDASNVVRRQGDKLDVDYVVDWLRQFEIALADSTLVQTFQSMRRKG